MGCCGADILAEGAAVNPDDLLRRETLEHAGHRLANGNRKFIFAVPSVHCGACIATIEKALNPLPGVIKARVNLTLRRLNLEIDETADIVAIADILEGLGHKPTPMDMGDLSDLEKERETAHLIKALAVAGFAAGNIMLLSVSVWSGADGPTRDLFHFISALIAIPVVAYSGQSFFRSAIGALRQGRLNMDVPISLAVVLALITSIFETFMSGEEAYFDAAVTLLFFLLIGRYLDHRMREKARNSVVSLARLAAKGANRITANGTLTYVPIDEIEPGHKLRILPGERVPVDCKVVAGASDTDRSLVTGESAPVGVGTNSTIEAGTLNLTGPLDVLVQKPANESFLSEVVRMLEAAENGRSTYVRVADRMASLYAPAVHLLALFAFIGWAFATGGDWYTALTVAIAVLIVTCPCALGLAVPVVHVLAATRLFDKGILMRDGAALERLAEIDIAVFDKTGTLTTGVPIIDCISTDNRLERRIMASLASHSRHPASRALSLFLSDERSVDLEAIREVPGFGIEATYKGKPVRLGRAQWVAEIASTQTTETSGPSFAISGGRPVNITFTERLRPGAKATANALEKSGIDTQILSGDSALAVSKIAKKLGIEEIIHNATPASKLDHLERLRQENRHPLMIGDGINDAPALANAHASMAPASAADVGRQAADFVLTRESLNAVPFAHSIATRAGQLVRQNFGLAIIYNCIAVPLAMGGYITPLFAAIAMSASSIVVITNSLRLLRYRRETRQPSGVAQNVNHAELVTQ